MKALKRKEVEEKLLKLLEVAGEGTTGLDGIDLEGDWDPEEHDRKMAEIYGEEYGGVTEVSPLYMTVHSVADALLQDPEFKPVWDDDIDISDLQALEDGASGDEAYDPSAAVVKAKKDKKGKRKRDDEGFPTALMEAAQRGGDKERAALLESMVDDYYGLDYEDKVGRPSCSHWIELILLNRLESCRLDSSTPKSPPPPSLSLPPRSSSRPTRSSTRTSRSARWRPTAPTRTRRGRAKSVSRSCATLSRTASGVSRWTRWTQRR